MNFRYNNITAVKEVSPILKEVILLYDLVKPLKPTTRGTREEVSLLLCLSICYNTRPRINRVAHPLSARSRDMSRAAECRAALEMASADTSWLSARYQQTRESLAAVRVTGLVLHVELCIITVGEVIFQHLSTAGLRAGLFDHRPSNNVALKSSHIIPLHPFLTSPTQNTE